MDKMLYLAMTSASNSLLGQAVVSNNLAHMNIPAFKSDFEQFRSMPVFGDGLPTRVYALQERPGIDFSDGTIRKTGNPLDFAINGEGWIAVQAPDGSEAYTRRGDMHVNNLGLLENGDGHLVLGNGGTIALPPAEKVEVAVDGTISIRPSGQDEKTIAVVDRIKLVNPIDADLVKGQDGLFRMRSGELADIDASIRLAPESLESSNVNMISAMVRMIELSRRYEMDIKNIQAVKENDEVATRIMAMS
ncbi:MAG: flagellar basal body rod protein FlgF [Pseudomonadota bacterium]